MERRGETLEDEGISCGGGGFLLEIRTEVHHGFWYGEI